MNYENDFQYNLRKISIYFNTTYFNLQYFAQEEEEEKKKFTFSGSIDAYYRTNFNALNKAIPSEDPLGESFGATAPGTSFANIPVLHWAWPILLHGMKVKKLGLWPIWFLDLGVRKQFLVLLLVLQTL